MEEATRTAVTFVMKDSIGSTVSLVTAIMNTSQVALSSFSSSFLLSICKRQCPLPYCIVFGRNLCFHISVHLEGDIQTTLPGPHFTDTNR